MEAPLCVREIPTFFVSEEVGVMLMLMTQILLTARLKMMQIMVFARVFVVEVLLVAVAHTWVVVVIVLVTLLL